MPVESRYPLHFQKSLPYGPKSVYFLIAIIVYRSTIWAGSAAYCCRRHYAGEEREGVLLYWRTTRQASQSQHRTGPHGGIKGSSGITDEELEKEHGGGGLRYSFDIASGRDI